MQQKIAASGCSRRIDEYPPVHEIWERLCLGCRTVSSACLLPNDLISVTWTQRDPELQRIRKYHQEFSWSETIGEYVASLPVEVAENVIRRDVSPSGSKTILFRGWEKDGDSGVIEVWGLGGFERAWEIDAKTHGQVYSDDWFGGVTWGANEDRVVYVAERSTISEKQEKKKWYEKGDSKYSEKAKGLFGETYGKNSSPALFVADLKRCVIKEIFSSKSDSFGDPRWSPNGKMIAATMRPPASFNTQSDDVDNVKTKTHELGVRYCHNRYSEIIVFAFDEEAFSVDEENRVALSEPRISVVSDNQSQLSDYCCSSPRWHPTSSFLVYVSAPRSSDSRTLGYVLPHDTTKILRVVSIGLSESGLWASMRPAETVVDVVRSAKPDEFPGLYLHSLPDRPWATPDVLVLGSLWGNETRPVEVMFEGLLQSSLSGSIPSVKCKTRASTGENSTVLDCIDGKALVFSSTFNAPGRLIIEDVEHEEFEEVGVVQTMADELEKVIGVRKDVHLVLNEDTPQGMVAALSARVYTPSSDDPAVCFQATLLVPSSRKEKGSCPLILCPHGGPHSASLSKFSIGTAAFLMQGQAVLLVNYRGSIGQGQDPLESLLGRAGTQDVSECLQATMWAVENEPVLDASRIGYHGGSHGGFIGCHLAVRFPHLFKRAVMRNPVVNISSFAASTDIPDWCFAESGAEQLNENGVPLIPDSDQLRQMYECSPIAHVKREKNGAKAEPCKTLLQVGGSDRRVPPYQSFEWKRALCEVYGTDCVAIRYYPESGHAIDDAHAGDDSWFHALTFLRGL